MRAPGIGARLAFLALLVMASWGTASCAFLQVESLPNASAIVGVPVSFPVSLKNQGANVQPVYLSAQSPAGVSVSFDVSSYTLTSGEQKTFNVLVDTHGAPAGIYRIPLEIAADEGIGSCYQYVNLTLNLSANVTPAAPSLDAVDVRLESDSGRIYYQGETAKFDVVITNNYDEEVIAALDAPDDVFSASTVLSETSVRIPAHSSHQIPVSITLPPGVPGGAYSIVLRVRINTACCIQEFSLPTTLTVFGKRTQLTFLREPLECIPVRQGQSASVELGIQNDGETEGPFSMELTGEAAATQNAQLQISQLELQPGERTFFNLTFTPTDLTTTDTYTVILNGKYLDFTLHQRSICYTVEGTKDLEITKPVKTEIQRCATASLPLTLRNTGTLSDRYALQPGTLKGVSTLADPKTQFTLGPGEKRDVRVILGASCNAPLGTQSLPVRIYSSESTRTEVLPVTVLPNASKELFLKIDFPANVHGIEGRPMEFTVSVANALSGPAQDTRVSILGIPENWAEVEGAKTIKSGATATFKVRIYPESAGTFDLGIVAASGLERSQKTMRVNVEPQVKELGYTYALDFAGAQPPVSEVRLELTVTNRGNIELKGITAGTVAPDVNVVASESIDSLLPGESKHLTAVLRPLQDTVAQTIPLRLRSNEGASVTQSVDLPALKSGASQNAFEFPWKIALIVVLLVLIFAMLGKQDERYQV